MKMILLGPPGAGKGTQAEVLSKHFDIPTISTGAMIRAEIRAESPLGLSAKKLIEEGQLVNDEVILGMLKERLKAPDCKNGFILDGVPRTIAQAEAIKGFADIDCAVSIDLADEVIVERLSGRRECAKCGATFHMIFNPSAKGEICDKCGAELTQRSDDMPETIRKRLDVYHKQTEPLIDFYTKEGLLKTIDGANDIGKITEDIIKAVEVTA
ncbi:MAG: adenylate kinase [Clostridia bacterium]|nr:adenylate kinase [Clostridia bacterium]